LSQARQKTPGAGYIDIIGDIVESANLIIRRPRTASVVLGGGTPKNFINQASVQAEFYSSAVGGHRYALQIVTDTPHFGGASGSSLEEAQSWGKLATDSARVSVQADATIALPLLASALVTTAQPLLASRKKPTFALASRVIRHVLVDAARSRRSLKRGGDAPPEALDDDVLVSEKPPADIIALDDALRALSAIDERKSQVVELRFFGGLTVEETAEVLTVSAETVKRDWKLAKAWLRRELRRE